MGGLGSSGWSGWRRRLAEFVLLLLLLLLWCVLVLAFWHRRTGCRWSERLSELGPLKGQSCGTMS